MAKDHGASVKDDKQYEGLRKKGMSKSRAAAIANAPGASKEEARTPRVVAVARAASPAAAAAAATVRRRLPRVAKWQEVKLGGTLMANPVPAGSDVSAGTYRCTNC